MSNIINHFKPQAQKIARQLDKLDGEDNRINADTWKKYAVAKFGMKDNVKQFINIFSAANALEKSMEKEANTSDINADDIGEKWYADLFVTSDNNSQNQPKTQDKVSTDILTPIIQTHEEQTDALKIDNSNNIIAPDLKALNADKKNITRDINAEKIISNMYAKWSGKFKNSPLGRDFYSKLYNTIKILNCSIKDSDFKKDIYSSKEEQTMDEFIAIFAGESQLNPATRKNIYRGLFQLAKDGLTDLKIWASKNQDVPGMKNIKNINIEQFGRLSGPEQLDYLVAYIGKAKEYSKIPKNQSITPGQVWAMIKNPFKGQTNSKITAEKNSSIKKVFTNNSIQFGSLA